MGMMTRFPASPPTSVYSHHPSNLLYCPVSLSSVTFISVLLSFFSPPPLFLSSPPLSSSPPLPSFSLFSSTLFSSPLAPLLPQFGDSQQLRLVRILRSTVMVRVGGGWMALDEFLVKNDPCRGERAGPSIHTRTSRHTSSTVIQTSGFGESMGKGNRDLQRWYYRSTQRNKKQHGV